MRTFLARTVLLTTTALLLAACGGSDDPETKTVADDAPDEPAATVEESELEDGEVDAEELELEEVGDSGITGTATVEPGAGDALRITIELDGETSDTHGVQARYGTCEDAIDPEAVDELVGSVSAFTLADVEDGRMQDEAELPEDIVREGSYTLVVHEGADVDGDIAACVDVEVTGS